MTAFYLGLRIQACKYFILEIAFVLMFRVEMAQKVFVGSMGCTGDSSAQCGNNGWVSAYGTGL